MARQFAVASTQYLSNETSLNPGFPVSMACWFYCDTLTVDAYQWLIALLGNSDNDYVAMYVFSNAGTIQTDSYDGTANQPLANIGGVTAGAWFHAAAVYSSGTSAAIYLNASKATGTSAGASAPLSSRAEIARGGPVYGAGANQFDGRIAEAGVWNVALTDDDVASLAKGFSPMLVRPEGLQNYWDLMGKNSPEIDRFGAADMTLNNAPTAGDHPPIITPPKPRPQYYIRASRSRFFQAL